MSKLVAKLLVAAAAVTGLAVDAFGQGVFLQDGTGLVSMEAEHFGQSVAGPVVGPWTVVGVANASGQQSIKAAVGAATNS
ncbi:MAG TPA: hypothetical protein VJA26_11785, partial [Gammaproteobacteria bacterium]|nr:hypothetical protein [Gammaproteobacteria bacterium]